ncbi:hypothetical protein Taro_025118 [Colocasia esculenta]|uniref:Uncharacterized protein n=1 Tax=Colocasia esculenta TaxID=4460 RepID=A0A843VBD6_COLES|nr:hypothetical protein [Colocasia esculenta]
MLPHPYCRFPPFVSPTMPQQLRHGGPFDSTMWPLSLSWKEGGKQEEDVNLMKEIGMDAYRFSISWTRILPAGSLNGGVNGEGIAYYNHLINELVSKGLQPFVTLFHWDSPQGLEDVYGGFLSSNIVKDFVDYAEVCFREFGDRVKYWITFNEPWSFCVLGYARGSFPPARCSDRGRCNAGDSGREPYTVCHHQLLAHAAAVKLYRDQYQVIITSRSPISLLLEKNEERKRNDVPSIRLDDEYPRELEAQ